MVYDYIKNTYKGFLFFHLFLKGFFFLKNRVILFSAKHLMDNLD